ncbi:MAG: phosphoenolpyruvate synthase [Bdellovibrionota bacterium]
MPAKPNAEPYIRWLKEISMGEVASVGGKTSSLGEMVRELSAAGISVPNGFAVTARGYWDHLEAHKLVPGLRDILSELNLTNDSDLTSKAYWARQLILSSPLPHPLEAAILAAYRELSAQFGELATDVAVRSSATAEDLPEASFAGQQETYLNVRGEAQLLEACRKCFASLFTERAISYRQKFGFDHLKVGLSICVQKMVRSDLASSGVMFTLDTETGFPNVVLINSAYGLGENIVQGTVNPDEFYVFKPTLGKGFSPILRKTCGTKELKLVYDTGGEKLTKNIPVSAEDRRRLSLSDEDALTLSRWAIAIEDHYSSRNGRKTPMDIEWAKDGRSGNLFIVQARPETVQSRKETSKLQSYHLKAKGTLLLEGHSVGSQIKSGKVRVIHEPAQRDQLQPGEVLVADKTDPDWEPAMRKASAVITTRGGRTCHAAIVSRELGIPAIVGALGATEILRDGQEVTVSCAEGDVGKIYAGILPVAIEELDLHAIGRPRTKIMINAANPDTAFTQSFLPNDGVGLAREEFIVSNHVKVHPMALVHFDHLKDAAAKEEIRLLTRGYDDKKLYFVDKLAEGAGTIAAAFYPKDVIIRLSDFKTNEYAHLLGGQEFEPREENPMLGFRGASRYYHPNYREGFALECRALKKVRDEMGLTNLKVMVPFCRTPEEGRKVLAEMEKSGLKRGENGLEVYVMCEIPSNVILAKEFADVFDGFSIGSNDLTQLVLGVDRDSTTVAGLFDERNPAVLSMISQVIQTAKARGRKIGICGQAPSDYPEFAAFLVREGIDSISLSSDAVLKTWKTVLDAETKTSSKGEFHGSAKKIRPA